VKPKFRKKSSDKVKSKAKKRVRIRKKVFGTTERPRLTVFRSSKHIYAQIVDDITGKTIVESSTLTTQVSSGGKGSRAAATAIGKDVATKAKSKNINAVVFDRSGYLYHGRVKALADAAREAGLQF
jgi:large subunit ribosomal protein L18